MTRPGPLPGGRFVLLLSAGLVLHGCGPGSGGSPAGEPDGDPAFARGLARADSAVADWVGREVIPGAVLHVRKDGTPVHERAFGHARLYRYGAEGPVRREDPVPMAADHLFDLASVTKVMGTTWALMLLVDRGEVALDAPVGRYLPLFSGPRKDSVRVRHLLSHAAGLAQWQPLYYRAATREGTYRAISAMPLEWGVGDARHYSDLGFMLLGYLVEEVTGSGLDGFLREELYGPLGLGTVGYLPRERGRGPFAATSHGNPFERRMVHDTAFGYRYDGDPDAWNGWRHRTLVGEVNDGNAYHANGGVAGHAGLFGTARELGVLVQLLLDGGARGGREHVRRRVVERFLARNRWGHGLGWRLPADAPAGTFDHTGFTGTYVAGIPAAELAIVLLTNRQNVGLGDDHRYPDVDPLRRFVRETLTAAATEGDRVEAGEVAGR